MVVNDFNVLRAASGPPETNPVLVVDPNTVLSSPAASEFFEMIARRSAEVTQLLGLVEVVELALRHRPKHARACPPCGLGFAIVEDVAGSLTGEGLDHGCIIMDNVTRGNQWFAFASA